MQHDAYGRLLPKKPKKPGTWAEASTEITQRIESEKLPDAPTEQQTQPAKRGRPRKQP